MANEQNTLSPTNGKFRNFFYFEFYFLGQLSTDSSKVWSAYVPGSPAFNAPFRKNYKNNPREKFKFWRENEFSPYFRHFPAEISQNVVLLCSLPLYIVI